VPVEVVDIVPFALVLQAIVAGSQPLMLGVIRGGAQGVGRLLQLGDQAAELVQGAGRLLPEGAAGQKVRLLLQIAQAGRGVQLQAAAIGLIVPGEDF
jgi:hypothetical protein